ncbi:MAG: glycosyltransferase [Planctomycetota bacterium]
MYSPRVRAEVVHVQHLMLLSLGIPRIAKERGIPVVMTLHDFWLFCSLLPGQLLRGDGSIRPVAAQVRNVLADFKFGQSSTEERLIKAISWTRRVSGFVYAPLVAGARVDALAHSPLVHAPPRRRLAGALAAARGRPRARCGELIHHVDVFTARPAGRCQANDRVGRAALGWQARALRRWHAVQNSARRAGTSGSRSASSAALAAQGVRLISAFATLRRGSAHLRIFGRFDYYPEYVQHLRSLARGLDVTFEGMVPREHVDRAFRTIDCLVVPSLWLENSPVVIQEAFLAAKPVITSDLGGMAELVKDRRTGRLFKPGDVRSLARCLRQVVKNPVVLEQWARNLEPPRTVEDNASELEAIYEQLLRAKHAPVPE